MNTKTYRKGEIIFRQGDAAESMFDTLWGRVGIYVDYGTSNEKKLTEIVGGQDKPTFFGEMGMIDHAPRSATAVALENQTHVQEITESELGELFESKPAKVLMLMQQLSGRLRSLTNDYMEACKTASGLVKLEDKADGFTSEDAEEVSARAERYANAASLDGGVIL